MPSPICEVKIGAGAYAATAGGVNITPGAVITIRLADISGVDSWSISCLTTDELSSAAAINAALAIDPATKTATFTAPASAGRALRFGSLINNGRDANNVARSDYLTTFCLYSLTSGGYRVIAADETTEGDNTFGWIASMNAMLRAGGGGGASPAGAGTEFQYRVSGAAFGAAAGFDYDTVNSKARFLNPFVMKDSDASAEYRWAVSNLAGNRVVTLPLLAADDTFVFQAHAQTLTNKTIAAGSNTITGIADTNIASGAAIAGSKVVPTFGAQNVSGANGAFTGTGSFGGHLDLGSSSAATGALGIPNGTANAIYGRNSANSGDVCFGGVDSSNRSYVGDGTANWIRCTPGGGDGGIQISGEFVLSSGSSSQPWYFRCGGNEAFRVTYSSGCMLGVPLLGLSTPYAAHGRALLGSKVANYTLASTEYSRHHVEINAGSTAGLTYTWPHPADDDHSYSVIVKNNGVGNAVIATGTGTTYTIAGATKKLVTFTPGGVEVL